MFYLKLGYSLLGFVLRYLLFYSGCYLNSSAAHINTGLWQMLQSIQGCFSECSKLPERLLATDLCAVRSLNERMYNAHDKATSRSCSISRCVGGNQSVKKINGSVLSGRHSAVNLYVFRVQRAFVFI